MTTGIYWRGKLYADTRVTETFKDGTQIYHETTKLYRYLDSIFTASGCCYRVAKFFKWYHSGMSFLGRFTTRVFSVIEYSNNSLILWRPKPIIYLKIRKTEIFFGFLTSNRYDPKETFICIGSGSVPAYEALNLGLEAPEAIQYASDRDPYTSDTVEMVTLNDLEGWVPMTGIGLNQRLSCYNQTESL